MSNERVDVTFGAQIAGLLAGLGEATAGVKESVGVMKEQMEGLAVMAEAMMGPFIAITALLAGGEMFKEVLHETAELATQLEVLNQKTGIGVEELSALKYAADQSHVSMESLTVGLQKLARGMEQAAKGGAGPVTSAFKALGIQAADASGHLRPLEDVLLQVADKFSTMQNGAGKTALAMDLFGRSGASLIPLLNRGKAGIADLEAEAHRLGVTMSGEDVEAAIQYEDAMKRMHGALSGLGRAIAVAVMPALTILAEGFTALIHLVEATGNAVLGLIDILQFDLVGAGIRFKKAMEDIKAIKGDFNPVVGKRAETGDDGAPAVEGKGLTVMEKLQHQWEQLKSSQAANFGALTDLELKFWTEKLATLDKGSKDYIEVYRHIVDLTEKTLHDQYEAGLGAFKVQEASDKDHLDRIVKDRQAELQFIRAHYAEMSKEVQAGLARVIEAQNAVEKQTAKQWATGFDVMASAFSRAVNDIGKNVFSLRDLFREAFANITKASLLAGLTMLRDHAAMELAKRDITAKSVAERVALDSWAALQSVAKSAWSALVNIGNYAAETIAATWASISAIPLVGPFAAPALAVGAGAAVLALAGSVHSAAGGFDIPAGINPMTQLHAQEMVLPAELANRVRGMTGGGDTHVHMNVQAWDSRDVKRFLMDNRDAIADAGVRAAKDGRNSTRRT